MYKQSQVICGFLWGTRNLLPVPCDGQLIINGGVKGGQERVSGLSKGPRQRGNQDLNPAPPFPAFGLNTLNVSPRHWLKCEGQLWSLTQHGHCRLHCLCHDWCPLPSFESFGGVLRALQRGTEQGRTAAIRPLCACVCTCMRVCMRVHMHVCAHVCV